MAKQPPTFDLMHPAPGQLLAAAERWLQSLDWFLAELQIKYPQSAWLPMVTELDQGALIDAFTRYLNYPTDFPGVWFAIAFRTRQVCLVLKLERVIREKQALDAAHYEDRWIAVFLDRHTYVVGYVSSFIAFRGTITPPLNLMARALNQYRQQLVSAQIEERRRGAEEIRRITEAAERSARAADQKQSPPPRSANPRARILRHIHQIVHDLPREVAIPLREYLLAQHPAPVRPPS